MAAGSRGRLAAPSPMLRPKENRFRPLLPPHHRTKEGHDSSPHRGLEGADSVSILQPLSLFNHRRYLQRVWSPVITGDDFVEESNPFHRGGSSCSRTETTINLMLCGKVPLCSWSSSKLLSLPDLIYISMPLQRKPWNSHSSLSQSSTGGSSFCLCVQSSHTRTEQNYR